FAKGQRPPDLLGRVPPRQTTLAERNPPPTRGRVDLLHRFRRRRAAQPAPCLASIVTLQQPVAVALRTHQNRLPINRYGGDDPVRKSFIQIRKRIPAVVAAQ